jgi:hypothetical protein
VARRRLLGRDEIAGPDPIEVRDLSAPGSRTRLRRRQRKNSFRIPSV